MDQFDGPQEDNHQDDLDQFDGPQCIADLHELLLLELGLITGNETSDQLIEKIDIAKKNKK